LLPLLSLGQACFSPPMTENIYSSTYKEQKGGKNTKDWEKNLKKNLKAVAAGEKLHPNVVIIILLLFLFVVVSVEKFHQG